MSVVRNLDEIEAAARALYEHWCAPDAPNWEAWETGADLNPVGLKPRDFREDAESIIRLDPLRAGRELCWRNAPCARIECSTIDECICDEYFIEAARKAIKAVRKR